MEQVVVPLLGAVATYSAKSALFTAGVADRGTFFDCTGSFTISLTAAATLGAGWSCWIRNVSGTQTVDPNGAELINGAATYALSNAGDVLLVECTGTAFVISHSQRPATVAITGGTLIGVTLSGSTSINPVSSGGSAINLAVTGSTWQGGTISGSTIASPTISGGTTVTQTISGTTVINPTISGGTTVSHTLSGSTWIGGTISGTTIVNPTITGGTMNATPIGGTTATTGAFTTLTASTGVTFPGTTASSSRATGTLIVGTAGSGGLGVGGAINAASIKFADAGSTLANYEEGTWTPTIIGGTTPGTQTYVANGQIGRYTRVGDKVFCEFQVEISAKDGAMAGALKIGGLPFTVKNVTGYQPAMGSGLYQGVTFTAGRTQLVGYGDKNATTIGLYCAGSAANVSGLTAADIAASTAIVGCIYYEI